MANWGPRAQTSKDEIKELTSHGLGLSGEPDN
jgi:hypothetical protein